MRPSCFVQSTNVFQVDVPRNHREVAACFLCVKKNDLSRAEVKCTGGSPTNLTIHLNTTLPGHKDAHKRVIAQSSTGKSSEGLQGNIMLCTKADTTCFEEKLNRFITMTRQMLSITRLTLTHFFFLDWFEKRFVKRRWRNALLVVCLYSEASAPVSSFDIRGFVEASFVSPTRATERTSWRREVGSVENSKS